MTDTKQAIITLISQIEDGTIPPEKAWGQIKRLKKEYVAEYNQSSWNSFIGHRFEGLVHSILKVYAQKNKDIKDEFGGLEVLTAGEAKSNEIILRKLAVKYGEFLLLPDVDSVIVWMDVVHPWESKILAIVSCKTSLRERIAQACYWKLKLLSSDVQKGINVFLATADNDDDFSIKEEKGRYDGKSRNRIISEYELDGIYILREDFRKDWESIKVKQFDKIFNDITQLMKNLLI
jgi:hypothetical protein